MIGRALVIWLVLLAAAVVNGAFREAVLAPRVGKGVAHALSTILLSLLILVIGWLTTPWVAPGTLQNAWTVGVMWLALTIAFEFLAGHFLFGRTWTELLADYDLRAGRIWVMVLIVTLMTPVLAFTRGSPW